MTDKSPPDYEKANLERSRFQSADSTDNPLSAPIHKENAASSGDATPPGYTSGDEDISGGFTPEEQKAIIRRVDRRLVITVGAMYCVSLMDRTNMSYANIAGMVAELKLTGFKYVSFFLLMLMKFFTERRTCALILRHFFDKMRESARASFA